MVPDGDAWNATTQEGMPRGLTAVSYPAGSGTEGNLDIRLDWVVPEGANSDGNYDIQTSVSEEGDSDWIDATVNPDPIPGAVGTSVTTFIENYDPSSSDYKRVRVRVTNDDDDAPWETAMVIEGSGGATVYADVNGTNPACTAALPCSLSDGITRAKLGTGGNQLLIQVSRAGGTVDIRSRHVDQLNLEEKVITFGLYNGNAPVSGTLNIDVPVALGSEAEFITHRTPSTNTNPRVTTTVQFSEIMLDNLEDDEFATLDYLVTAGDVEVKGSGMLLVKEELTVNNGHTLTLEEDDLNLRVPLKKGTTAKPRRGILTVNGDIEGDGRIWIAHVETRKAADDVATDYSPTGSAQVIDNTDCVRITGSGAIETDIVAVATGNLCMEVPQIGSFSAVGGVTSSEDITTDVFFRTEVEIDGDLVQSGDAGVIFEETATITQDVTLEDTGSQTRIVDLLTGLGSEAVQSDKCKTPGENEYDYVAGVEFNTGITIEGSLALTSSAPISAGENCHPTVQFKAPRSNARADVSFMTHIGENLEVVEVANVTGRVHLESTRGAARSSREGSAKLRRLTPNFLRGHNLMLDGGGAIVASGMSITMGDPAKSLADGQCTGEDETSLTGGNRIVLGEGGDVVIDGTLEIPTLVVMNELEIAEGHKLTVHTLKTHDRGELNAGGDGEGIVNVTTALILGGEGLDGSLDPGSELGTLVYASSDGTNVVGIQKGVTPNADGLGPFEVLSMQIREGSRLRLNQVTHTKDLGLCSGNLVLREAGTTKDSTIYVHEELIVRDGSMLKDANRPGSIGTDYVPPATGETQGGGPGDGYTLKYVNASEHTVGDEWFGVRDVVVSNSSAVIIHDGEATVSIPGHLTIASGHFHVKNADLIVGEYRASGAFRRIPDAERKDADDNLTGVGGRYLTITGNGELHTKGNDVVVYGPVTVGTHHTHTAKILTDGGNLHVLGNDLNARDGETDLGFDHPNAKGLYESGTAAVTVAAQSVIDVGLGNFQLGPECTRATNRNQGDARPDVSLNLKKHPGNSNVGIVKGVIRVPRGSKQTRITGEGGNVNHTFNTVIFDGTANPRTASPGNHDGTLYIHGLSSSTATVDSLSATQGFVEFHAMKTASIAKNVVSSSATIWSRTPKLEFKGNLTLSGTGGLSNQHYAGKTEILIHGDFTQNAGTRHPGNIDGVWLAPDSNTPAEVKKTVMGALAVADGAYRYHTSPETKLVLKGNFSFGKVTQLASPGNSMLNADLEFSGKEVQSVAAAKDLNNVNVNGAGIILASDVMQGRTSVLTLTKGAISGDHTWLVKNTTIEENLVQRTAARTGEHCPDDNADPCSYSIERGSRQSYASAMFARHLVNGSAGGGEVTGGYLFPTGMMGEDRAHYRPAILQLPVDLAEPQKATVSLASVPEGKTPAWPSENLQVHGGTLTLDVHSDIYWKVDLGEEELASNVNLRVAASGLSNVFNPERLRIVQWDCEWMSPRLAGQYDLTGGNTQSFAVNDYVNGVLNITQEGIDIGSCSIFGIAANQVENPINQPDLASGRARLQFVHNAQIPAPVNVKLDGDLEVVSGATYQSATGYLHVAAGVHSVSVEIVGAPDDQQPASIGLGSLANDRSYAVVAHGGGANLAFKRLDTRMEGPNNTVEVLLVHGSADLGRVRLQTINILDDPRTASPTRLLANNFSFDQATNYIQMDPGYYRIEAISGSDKVAVFDLNLSGYQGQTLIANLSGSKAANNLDLYVVDKNGSRVNADVVTGTESEITEIPTEFALHGNYPNPFNPSTRIQFDLPESAQVTVQVVDMLGREVMALPAKEFEAGSNRSIELNATNLASGTYLYRMIATGAESRYVKTGRMTLVK